MWYAIIAVWLAIIIVPFSVNVKEQLMEHSAEKAQSKLLTRNQDLNKIVNESEPSVRQRLKMKRESKLKK